MGQDHNENDGQIKICNDIYQVMFQAIKTGDLGQIIRAAWQVMGRPLIITDTAYVKLIEIFPAEPQGDSKWDAYLPGAELDTESIRHIYENNYIEQMREHFEPVMMNQGYFADSPRLTAPVIIEKNLVGYVSMLSGSRECSEDQKAALQVVADSVAIFLQGREKEEYEHTSLRRIFSQKIIFGELQNRKEMEEWCSLVGVEMRPPYMILLAGLKQSHQGPLYNYMKIRLGSANLPMLQCQQDNNIYILFYSTGGETSYGRYISQIRDIIQSFSLGIGVSEFFEDLEKVNVYRKQAQMAFQIGEKIEPLKNIHYYQELVIPSILYACVDVLGWENCLHPAPDFLRDYDRAHDTEYQKTLRALLYHSFDHAETCRVLHIHRNTLNYRIARLSEIASINLEDPETRFHLYLTFRIMDYKQSVQKTP